MSGFGDDTFCLLYWDVMLCSFGEYHCVEEHSASTLYTENGGSVLLQKADTHITEYTLSEPSTPVVFKLFLPWNPFPN